MPDDLVIFPFGGNGREAALTIEAMNAVAPRFKIIGYIDDNHSALNSNDYPLLGGSEAWAGYAAKAKLLAVPGSPRSFQRRRELIGRFGLAARHMVSIVDPSARVAASAQIGANTLVMANCFVSTGAVIGNHCVVLPNSVVSHDAKLGDYALVGSNVSISGSVEIGESAYIGSGARLREGVRIGEGALVGLGAVVVHDVPPRAVVAGVPARAIRQG